MLKESLKIRQSPGENYRRWFADDDLDLVTWQTTSGKLSAFQLCFNKTTDERALLWRRGQTLTHCLVDSGEPGPTRNLSPMLVDSPIPDLPHLIAKFNDGSANIDPEVRQFVLSMLQENITSFITLLGTESPGGVYLLRVYLAQPTTLTFGRHRGGTPIPLPRGEYLYIGSALSALTNRLLRHATRGGNQPAHQIRDALHSTLIETGLKGKLPTQKTVRWHIDYLLDLPSAEITAVLALRTDQKLEKPLAESLAALPETLPVSPGLGASDHPGQTHLLQVKKGNHCWERIINDWSICHQENHREFI
ncbi:MAG: GIY-YIG nuclease family protein [Chloroflexota bacterium]